MTVSRTPRGTRSRRSDEASELVRLLGNGDACADRGHFLCWRVHCRACDAVLRDHVEADHIERLVPQLTAEHRCPDPRSGPTGADGA